MDQQLFNQLLDKEIEQMSRFALTEDLAGMHNSDITAELIPESTLAEATLITREDAIICGVSWVNRVFELVGNGVTLDWQVKDGDSVTAGQTLCRFSGNARQMLTAERSAMNFLQSLSATATLTNQFVTTMNNPNCKLLDTRKTIPGMRFGQKYAVACGGGTNHRIGLSDAYLIKENHIMACGGIAQALSKAIETNPDKLLEIEVENLDELNQALDGKAQVIMLDNFTLSDMETARSIADNHQTNAKLEASGNVSLQTISAIAKTGVNFISVGALTKDIKALDLSLRIQLEG